MPYIKQELRDLIDTTQLRREGAIGHPGILNFVLTEVIWSYHQNNGGGYQQVNDVLGALEGAKLEFYRRVAAPYEDKKIIENGDVYD